MSGEAFRMRTQLAKLQARHGIKPAPFTPLTPLAPTEYDVVRQGLASPATVDREMTNFAADCWTPFKADVPLLFRHLPEQPAGRIEEIRRDKDGLFVRARIRHAEAKCCPYFSVAATVHAYQIVQAGAQSYGLITSATLDDVSMVFEPGNADALAKRPPAAAEFYDLAQSSILCMIRIVDVLKELNVAHEAKAKRERAHALTRVKATRGAFLTSEPAHIAPPKATQFSELARQLSERS